MELKYYDIKKLNNEILEIASSFLDLEKYKLFYFGSRVSSMGDDRSDIDVGIEGRDRIDDRVFAQILEKIGEIPIIYKIDFVDFGNVREGFYRVAKSKVLEIN